MNSVAKVSILIQRATEQDIKGIISVNKSALKTEKSNGLLQSREEDEFRKLLKICKFFLVAKVNGQIAGYLTVLDESAPYAENEIFSFYLKHYKGFVFVDQIATHADYRRMGVARKLFEYFLKREKKKVLLDVLIKPINPESIAFHESMGFRRIGDIIHLKNGMEAEVFEYRRS